MPLQVVNGAMLMCDQGAAPSTLVVPPLDMVFSGNQTAATIMDHIPMVNIMPFGMCRSLANPMVQAATAAAQGVLTPMPCIPATASPWSPGESSIIHAQKPALTQTCSLNCMWSGTIKVLLPGQFTHMLGKGSGGGGGGGGGGAGAAAAAAAAAAAGAGASGAGAAAEGAKGVATGLGAAVDALAAGSPSLQADLTALQNKNWRIVYGTAGKGSYASRSGKNPTIVIDSNLKSDPLQATQVLAHEVGHATYNYTPDESSRDAYVKGALADEGAATMNNLRVQREIQASQNKNIGIAGNTANHDAYNKAYDDYVKSGDSAKARDQIGAIFGDGEKTSTTGQTYKEYYGSAYDKNHPPSGK